MNRKYISVFFSVLLGSTLAHESLKAHELSGHHKRAHHLGFHQYKAATLPPSCIYMCPVPSVSPEFPHDFGLELLNIGGKIISFVNTTSLSTISFQIGQSVALLVNGKAGVTIYIDIEKGVGIYFASGSNNQLWLRSKILFTDYLEQLGSLNSVLNWKNGQNFNLKSIPKEIVSHIGEILKDLSLEISKVIEINPNSVIAIITVLVKGLLKATDVVNLILSRLKSEVTIVLGGVTKFLNTVTGLNVFKDKLPNGIRSLQDLIIDDEQITLALSASSGLQFLSIIGYHLIGKVNLAKTIGNSLDTPEKLMNISVVIDGGSYVGISGITAVIYNVMLYASKKISLEALIDILIQVEAANTVKISKEQFNQIIIDYIEIIQAEGKDSNGNPKYGDKKKFFQDIKDEKLIIGNINVSVLINILINTSGNISINNLLKVLLELKAAVSVTKIVSTLFIRLIWCIVSGHGLIFVNALLPSITITIDFSSGQNILKQILSKVQIGQLTKYIITFDVVGLITHLPVLGPIFVALEASLKAIGVAAQVSLTSALKQSGAILTDLKNLIWFALGLGGGSIPSGGQINGIGAIEATVTVSVSVTSGSSGGGVGNAGGGGGGNAGGGDAGHAVGSGGGNAGGGGGSKGSGGGSAIFGSGFSGNAGGGSGGNAGGGGRGHAGGSGGGNAGGGGGSKGSEGGSGIFGTGFSLFGRK